MTRAEKLRGAAGALDILVQQIVDASKKDELLRAHYFCGFAISLLELMRIATDEALPGPVRTTTYREMNALRDRVERVFAEREPR